MPPHPLAPAPTHRHRRHHQAAAVVGSRVCSGQPAPPPPSPLMLIELRAEPRGRTRGSRPIFYVLVLMLVLRCCVVASSSKGGIFFVRVLSHALNENFVSHL